MLRKTCLSIFIIMCMCLLPLTGFTTDLLTQADQLFEQGGLENYAKAYKLYEQVVQSNPESYEANWKLARAYRHYAEYAKRAKIDGWKDICAKFGKLGMKYAEKAIELNPNGVEGHFYYGLCVGIYSDGVSIFRALKEGLKNKTQEHFEKAYAINKTYRDATPILALGRFWQVLPWPLRSKKKALKYYAEADELMPKNSKYRPELDVYYGELLLKKDKKRALTMLQEAASSNDTYFSAQAKRILEDNK